MSFRLPHLAVHFLLGWLAPASAAVITYGPISYQSRTQSPFYEGIAPGSFVTVVIQRSFRPSIYEDDSVFDERRRGRSLTPLHMIDHSRIPETRQELNANGARLFITRTRCIDF